MARSNADTGAGIIQARILDFPHGVRTYDNVQSIRISSKDYSLLIMADYMPIIGQVNGCVEIRLADGIVKLDRTEGFFMHHENEFSLLIESQEDAAAQEGQTDVQ